MKSIKIALPLQAILFASLPLSMAWADEEPGGYAESPGGDGQQGPTVIQIGPGATPYPGTLPPQGFNPDAHLPSSSRSTTDTSRPSDGFDLLPESEGPVSVRGNESGSYVIEGNAAMPEAHTVRRGDTLWQIATRYYQNPYQWPRVWSQNPQIQNPHWIYPGDRVRLRESSVAGASGGAMGLGLVRGSGGLPPQTIVLREMGWVDDKKEDAWGEVVGSPSDKMMLSEGDEIYLRLAEKRDVQVGQSLTIFRPIRTVESKNAKGELVSIRGTVIIDRYNPDTRMARARITESLDVIERGAKIGPVGRRFDVVPPAPSDQDIEAHILATVWPLQHLGQQQVVFIDRGEKDGVKPGQRFFAVERGDRWVDDLKNAGPLAKKRPRVEDDRPAKVDDLRMGVDRDLLPDETYAELRVLRVRDHTAAAMVTASKHEVPRNARLVSRKGL